MMVWCFASLKVLMVNSTLTFMWNILMFLLNLFAFLIFTVYIFVVFSWVGRELRLFFVLLCPSLRATYFFGLPLFYCWGIGFLLTMNKNWKVLLIVFFNSELLSTRSKNVTMSIVWLRKSVNLSSVFTLLIVCSLACSFSLTMYRCVKVKTLIGQGMIRTKISYDASETPITREWCCSYVHITRTWI
jgi:hypothetical protein